MNIPYKCPMLWMWSTNYSQIWLYTSGSQLFLAEIPNLPLQHDFQPWDITFYVLFSIQQEFLCWLNSQIPLCFNRSCNIGSSITFIYQLQFQSCQKPLVHQLICLLKTPVSNECAGFKMITELPYMCTILAV